MENQVKKELLEIYNKKDIMKMFKCESDKALRILKIMYQMKVAIKIGKEYYVEKKALIRFLEDFQGEEIFI